MLHKVAHGIDLVGQITKPKFEKKIEKKKKKFPYNFDFFSNIILNVMWRHPASNGLPPVLPFSPLAWIILLILRQFCIYQAIFFFQKIKILVLGCPYQHHFQKMGVECINETIKKVNRTKRPFNTVWGSLKCKFPFFDDKINRYQHLSLTKFDTFPESFLQIFLIIVNRNALSGTIGQMWRTEFKQKFFKKVRKNFITSFSFFRIF